MTIVTIIIMKMMRMVMITKTTAVKLLVGTVDGGSVAIIVRDDMSVVKIRQGEERQ